MFCTKASVFKHVTWVFLCSVALKVTLVDVYVLFPALQVNIEEIYRNLNGTGEART